MSRPMSERQKVWFVKGYITVKVAAEKTGFSEDTILRMVNSKKLDAKLDAGTRFVSIASLEACMKLPADLHDPYKAERATDRRMDFRPEIRQVGRVPAPRPKLGNIPEVTDGTAEQRSEQLRKGRLSVRHAATILGRHHATIYRAIDAEKLKVETVGGEKFVTLKSLIDWVGDDAAKEFGLVKR